MSVTTNLALNEPAYNSTSPTWDQPLNYNATILDQMYGNTTSVAVSTSSSTTNTNIAAPSATASGSTSQAMRLNLTGALAANQNVLLPQSVAGMWVVSNNTTGTFTVTMGSNNGSNVAAGTTVACPQGSNIIVYCDGTNVNTAGATTIADGSVTPAKLSTGGPSWNTSGDVTATGGLYGAEAQVTASLAPSFLAKTSGASASVQGYMQVFVVNEAGAAVGGIASFVNTDGSSNGVFVAQTAGARTDRRVYPAGWNAIGLTGDGSQLTGINSNQTAQNVLATRALGTTYTNTTGRAITVSVAVSFSNGSQPCSVLANINGSGAFTIASSANSGGGSYTGGVIQVPPGATYAIIAASTGGLYSWWEIR